MAKKLPGQTRNNNRTFNFTAEGNLTNDIRVRAKLEALSWAHDKVATHLQASDEGVKIFCSAPNDQGSFTDYTIELKDVPLPFLHSCLYNVNLTGEYLMELEGEGHTMKSALRHVQLAALVRRGLVTLMIRELPSFDPIFSECIVFTLEICGIPFSSIENLESDTNLQGLRKILALPHHS